MPFDIAKLARKAKKIADNATNAPRSVTYNSISIGAYNPATGTTSTTTTPYNFKAPIFGYEESETDGEAIKVGDMRMEASLDDLPVTPKLTDTVIEGGITWNVVNFTQEVKGITPWLIQIRMA